MKCSQCQTHLASNAKFCPQCGTPVSQSVGAAVAQTHCISCGGQIPAAAKFCNICGAAQVSGADLANKDMIEITNHYAMWNVMPRLLAVKIDEQTMAGYKGVRGLYIAPGTRALFFVNGHHVASLESGKYPFHRALRGKFEEDTAMDFLQSVANHIVNGIDLLFTGKYLRTHNFYTVVLVKGTEFSLAYDLQGIYTKNIRSNIALQMLCKITDLNAFFEALLIDEKYISIADFQALLLSALTSTLNSLLRDVPPQDVSDNLELIDKLTPAIEECLQSIYPYVSLENIVRLTADQQAIEALRKAQEQLYVDNANLDQTQLRNEYINRSQNVGYDQQVAAGRLAVDFNKQMYEIDRDNLSNDLEDQTLTAQKRIEEYLKTKRSFSELDVALDKLQLDGLLSREAVDRLKRDIQFGITKEQDQHAGELAILKLRNQIAEHEESLDWNLRHDDKVAESAVNIDKRDFEWQREKYKETEETRLEADKAQYEFAKKQHQDALEYQKQMDAHQMELLKQAQILREQRLQAAHERDMELRKQTADADLAKQKLELDTELETQKLYYGMTAEQIMMANPHLTQAAADAMSKKFEAEIAAKQKDEYVELLKQHNQDIKDMARDQQQLTHEVLNSELKHSATLLDNKQQELDRVNEANQKHEERLLSGVQNASSSVANAIGARSRSGLFGSIYNPLGADEALFSSSKEQKAPLKKIEKKETEAVKSIYCTNCGKKHTVGTKVCDACDTALE